MDEATFKTWEALHRRVSRGETLSAEEEALHEAGIQQLDAEETITFDYEEIRRIKAQIAEFELEADQLRVLRKQLAEEIKAMEANLRPQVREKLKLGN